MVELRALGALTVVVDGQEHTPGGPRLRRLLAVLLLHRGSVVSVDRIAEVVFAGAPTAAAGTTLRSYVARTRRLLDRPGSPSLLVTVPPGYVLRVSGEAFDVAVFERLVDEAGTAMAAGEGATAAASLRRALALWRGEPYAEFADEDWARPEVQRLGELRLVAYERLVEAELASGRAMPMVPEVEALCRANPLREAFCAQLMTAYARSGRHADALRAFQEHRRTLVEELGLEPSPSLVELERRVLEHDPTLLLDHPSGRPLRGYRLGERLGTGRSGTTVAARQPGVERDVAIRVIRADLADAPDFVRDFEATAHRVASLRHPAVVAIHDYWREPGAAYVVMRRLHGGSLADRLERGPLGQAAAAAVVTRIGGALVAAAEAGIVHGQVSAASVLFDESGLPHLSDFALGPGGTDGDDDRRDFAHLLAACVPPDATAVHDLLDRVLDGSEPAPMRVLVPALTAALVGSQTVEGSPPNPYKGLRAFDEADAADFFGRDEVVAELLARLSHDDLQGRLVLVVGGSGTGKSSVVRAGLLPRVRAGGAPGSERWLVTTMVPGSSPFTELAESLRRIAVEGASVDAQELRSEGGIDRVARRVAVAGDVLLVVDQLEELFTSADERAQRAFLRGVHDAVTAPGSRLRVVATLRADYYDRPLAVQPFSTVVRQVTVTVPAMLPAELEAAIVEPATRIGASVEQGLVAELVSAVVDQPAALPSLQFALFELAERTPTRRLTREAHHALGGIDGAIAARAEALYDASDDAERETVRRLFEHLVNVDVEGEPTRRRATRSELAGAGPGADDVVDRWVQARLLTVDRHPQSRMPTVEVAHEALLRQWPRVRRWLEESRASLVVLGRLREAASGWHDLSRDRGALYRGARLDLALEVVGDRLDDLSVLERELLTASVEQRQAEEREVEERATRQSRTNRRLRTQLAMTGAALVVALVGGFVAVDQREEARHERRRANARALAAAAEADLDADPERSILLALEAIDLSDGDVPPEVEEALHHAVARSRAVLAVADVGGLLDWSPDGRTFATEGPEESGLVDVRDADTGARVRAWEGHDVDVNGVAFSADGTMLATTGDDGALRVWDPSSGELLLEHVDDRTGRRDGLLVVRAPAFSPDGSLVAAGYEDVVRLLDVGTGEVVGEVQGAASSSGAASTAFSPDGRLLAIGELDGDSVARITDVASGALEVVLGPERKATTWEVAWAPDGSSLATVGDDASVRLWDASTGALRASGSRHTAVVNGVEWAPDGERLATVGEDGIAVVWAVSEEGLAPALELAAEGRSQSLFGVDFSPDGSRLMTGDLAAAWTTVWDLRGGGSEGPHVPATPWNQIAFTPAGGLVRNDEEGAVDVVDAETGSPLDALDLPPGVERLGEGHLETSPDGRSLAAGSFDGTLVVWDQASRAHRFTLSVPAGINDLAWSPDGEHLALATHDGDPGQILVVDRDGAVVSSALRLRGQRFMTLSFSPDGRRLATTREGDSRVDPTDMPVEIWDWRSGSLVRSIETSAGVVTYHPIEDELASGGRVAAELDVWDAGSGERLATMSAGALIGDLVYSPDGTALATSHSDGGVRLWEPRSGVRRLTLEGHPDGVGFLAFSPDGTKLAANGADGLVRLWALDVADLVDIARSRLTRGLTDVECRQHLRQPACRTG